MYRQLIPAIITGSILITPAFAFNPMTHNPAQKFIKSKIEPKKSLQSKKRHFTDFSGIWEGSCESDGEINQIHNFIIQNDENVLILSGRMYVIGDNYGETQSNEYFQLQTNTKLLWNTNQTALEMHQVMVASETDSFDQPLMNMASKYSLFFKNNEELALTYTANGYNTNGDTPNDKAGEDYFYLGLHTMSCTLKKQQDTVG